MYFLFAFKIVLIYVIKRAGVCCRPCNPSKWEADFCGSRSRGLLHFTGEYTCVCNKDTIIKICNDPCCVVTDWTLLPLLPFFNHFWPFFGQLPDKAEIQTVILRFWTSLNLHWFKSYDTNHKSQIFPFLFCFSPGCFRTIFWTTTIIFFTKLKFRQSFWGAEEV